MWMVGRNKLNFHRELCCTRCQQPLTLPILSEVPAICTPDWILCFSSFSPIPGQHFPKWHFQLSECAFPPDFSKLKPKYPCEPHGKSHQSHVNKSHACCDTGYSKVCWNIRWYRQTSRLEARATHPLRAPVLTSSRHSSTNPGTQLTGSNL